MEITPLRYNISSWRQIPECLSNNSKCLSLHITDYFNESNFAGFRISVEHTKYGTLFACCLNTKGIIVDADVPDMTTAAILAELARFGFYITYEPMKHLSGAQISYLMTLMQLQYDKLRILNVWHMDHGVQVFKQYIVAFNVENMADWLNNGYAPSEQEFLAALESGKALNLNEITEKQNFTWDWLTFVANIEDILRDQAYIEE